MNDDTSTHFSDTPRDTTQYVTHDKLNYRHTGLTPLLNPYNIENRSEPQYIYDYVGYCQFCESNKFVRWCKICRMFIVTLFKTLRIHI